MRDFGKMRLPWLRIRLRRAVKEGRADTAVEQRPHASIGMRWSRIVVTPVDERGRPEIDLVERTHQGRDVNVLGSEQGRKTGMHAPKILRERPVRRKPAQGRLPGMHVGVDSPGITMRPRPSTSSASLTAIS